MLIKEYDTSGQTRVHPIGRGLFVLRYAASKAHGAYPTVRVVPQDPAETEFLHWPDSEPQELIAPGDGLVIHARRDTAVALTVRPSRPGGSVDAELSLEPVSRLAHSSRAFQDRDFQNRALPAPRAAAAIEGLEILAHVARRGDVVAEAGEWICGPDLPMAIEGIELRWPDRPDGVEIITRVSVKKNGVRPLPECLTGEFAGTRGKAAPLSALEFSLAGARAQSLSLRVDALFLGAAVQSKSGRSISLTGPTGREPLVGLRLSVEPAEQARVSAARPQPAPQPAQRELARTAPSWRSSGRVRVFRGTKKGSSEALNQASERI